MKEFDFISDIASRFGGGSAGIGDDAALFGEKYLIAKDIVAENVHFLKYAPIETIIKKLFDSNVSDIAAMGGTPAAALLGVAACKGTDMKALAEAVEKAAGFYGIKIIGGDTSESPSLNLSMTIIGERGKNLLLRSGAKPGDLLYLSRPVGLSKARLENELGVKIHPSEHVDGCEANAEKEAGIFLGSRMEVTSATDVSDGLGRDAGHIAAMSGVKIILEGESLKFPELAFLKNEALSYALSSGEEFALIFTVKENAAEIFEKDFFKTLGRRPLKIGEVSEGKGCFLKNGETVTDVSSQGYEHFSA